jgi:ribosomal protein S18 acetylase RimI-like enzyme
VPTALNTNITLRPAERADEEFLLNLRIATMTEHLKRVGSELSTEQHTERLRDRYQDASVICLDDTPIGLFKAFREKSTWVIGQFQIAPEYQNKGIGSYLLRTFLSQAQKENVPVQLSVLRGNPARRLYESLGFRPISKEADIITLMWNPEMKDKCP